ncbi:MAG: ABC transporter substrate-binding protein [Burkholderiaceae bacterium]|nr:ABC transporter substrate-binding protein [Burkholderiaceae bacterium]
MPSQNFSRRSFMGAAGALLAPAFLTEARAQSLTPVSYQIGWLPQPDKGGLYQALATGLYREAGLDVEIRPGGPQLNVVQIFMAGRVDFADTDSFRPLNFVKEGLPGIAVAAFGQKSLNVMMSHPGTGHDTLAALKGKPVLVSPIGRTTYWPWLRAKFGLSDDQIRPYAFNLATFLADSQISREGFITSEPFDARKAGMTPVVHLLADHGYSNYSNVMLASPKMVADRPDVVQRFVDATARGWKSYVYGDPTPGNALIKKGNPELTDEKIAYAIGVMRSARILESSDTASGGIGAMTDARWKAFYDEMAAVGALPSGLDPRKAYTTQFVNKRAAVL